MFMIIGVVDFQTESQFYHSDGLRGTQKLFPRYVLIGGLILLRQILVLLTLISSSDVLCYRKHMLIVNHALGSGSKTRLKDQILRLQSKIENFETVKDSSFS